MEQMKESGESVHVSCVMETVLLTLSLEYYAPINPVKRTVPLTDSDVVMMLGRMSGKPA